MSRIGYCITNLCRVVMSRSAETSGFRLNLLFVRSQISPRSLPPLNSTGQALSEVERGRDDKGRPGGSH